MPSAPRKKGNVALIVALMLGVLLLFAALAIDVGMVRAQAGQAQIVADASALAGAGGLAAGDGLTGAQLRAVETAAVNTIGGAPHTLPAGNVEVGDFDFATKGWTTNATGDFVRVTVDAQVPSSFATLAGISSFDVHRTAIAEAVTADPILCTTFGETGFFIHGNPFLDSYDSGGVGDPYTSAGSGEELGICTNGQGSLNGNCEVYGDTASGPGYTTSGSCAVQSGDDTSLADPFVFPPIDWSVPLTNDNNSLVMCKSGATSGSPSGPKGAKVGGSACPSTPFDLKVGNGDTLTLGPGTYYVDDLDVKGILNIVPPTEIFVEGDYVVNAGGEVNTVGTDPHNTSIYVKGKSTVNGGGDFYGSLVSEGDVNILGGGDFYGLFHSINGEVEVGGDGTFHFDVSLPNAYPWVTVDSMVFRLVD